jgi:PAS domain S-box-containing protein
VNSESDIRFKTNGSLMPDKISVLYVDDEESLLELGKLFLESIGDFSVTTVASPAEALTILSGEQSDVIVSDYQMPEMDGIAFLKAVRNQFGDIPFILFTGRGREEVVIEAINNGADFYLQKGGPPDAQFAELAHKIRQAVRTKKTELSLSENREYLERIYSSVQGGIVIIDAKTHEILDLNPAAEKIIGTARDQIIGRVCHRFICPAEQGKCPITDLHQNVDNAERVLLSADGTRHDIIKYVVPFSLQGRECLLETFLDNTERKAATDNLKAAYEKLTVVEEELRQNYDALSKKEQALRKSEEQLLDTNTFLENLITYAASPIVTWDVNSRITRFNKAFAQLTGFSETDMLGHDFDILFPEESRAESLDLVCQALFGRRWESVEIPVRTIHGETRTVIWNSSCIYEKDGVTPLATIAMGTDITERKKAERDLIITNEELHAAYEQLTATEEELRAHYDTLAFQEQALRASEEKYRLLTETTSDVIYLIDTQGIITHISPQISRYGYTPEEVISHNIGEFIHEDDLPRVLEDMKKSMATGVITVTRMRIRDRAGKIRWMEDNGAPVYAPSGAVTAISGILRDVTERQDSEDALRESEEKFRALVEHSLEGILITDFTGRLLFANAAAGSIVESDDYLALIGKKNVLDYIAPESQAAVLSDFSKVLSGTDAYLVRYKLITEKGREVWAECIGKKMIYEKTPAMLVSLRDVTARRKAEEELRNSEEFTSAILDNIPNMVFVKEAGELRFVRFNKAGEELLGHPRSDLYGKNDYDFFPKEEADFFTGKDRDVLRNKKLVDIPEETIQTKDKGERILHTKKIPILDHDGNARYILGISEDITERRQADVALRESEQKFATVFRNNPIPLTLSSAGDGIFVDVNDAFLKNTGFSREEVIGKTSGELGIFVNPGDFARMITEIRTRHEVNGMEMDCRAKNGEVRTCRFSSRAILMGNRPHIISSIENVTERRKAEEALRESEEKYRMLVEMNRDGVFIVQDGRLVFYNNALAGMSGYTRDELKDRPLADIIAPEDRETVLSRARDRAQGKEVPEVYEFSILHKDGAHRFPVRAHAGLAQYRGRPASIGTFYDITESKRAEEALRQANRKLNLLSSITRHDIRNQLMTLDGFVAILKRRIPPDCCDNELLRITTASSQIAGMIQFTRDYQQVGINQPVWQDLRSLVSGAGKAVTLGSVTLRNDIPAGAEVFADPLVTKVFSNLVDNALRHGGAVSTIRFSLETPGPGCTVVCEDDGAGIAPEIQKKIFRKGFGKNTGFGLFLSREVLDITGITVTETGQPGKGARFEIIVPAGAYRIAP